jgi:hypothetical protein
MYHIYMPVDMVVMLSTNKYRRYYKKEQTNDKLLEKKELQVENLNSTCIELFKFW